MLRLAPLLLLALAMSATSAPAAPGKEEGGKEEGGKRICRPAAPTIGSHIKRSRICRTAAEWEELDSARRGPDITVKPRQPESWERTRPQ